MAEYNLTHTGAELDDAINKVKSGFLNPSDIDVHCTKAAFGNIPSRTSDVVLTGYTINFGFKPKIFCIRANGGLNHGSTRQYLGTSFFALKDDGTYYEIDGNPARFTERLYYYSSQNAPFASYSTALSNTFQATETGVKFSESHDGSHYLKGNLNYMYYAFG